MSIFLPMFFKRFIMFIVRFQVHFELINICVEFCQIYVVF